MAQVDSRLSTGLPGARGLVLHADTLKQEVLCYRERDAADKA